MEKIESLLVQGQQDRGLSKDAEHAFEDGGHFRGAFCKVDDAHEPLFEARFRSVFLCKNLEMVMAGIRHDPGVKFTHGFLCALEHLDKMVLVCDKHATDSNGAIMGLSNFLEFAQRAEVEGDPSDADVGESKNFGIVHPEGKRGLVKQRVQSRYGFSGEKLSANAHHGTIFSLKEVGIIALES